MTAAEEEFLRSLRATFKVEAAEHLQDIGTGLLELEKAAAPEAEQQLIETVFRAAHSLKGAARAVNFTEIESLCELLEDLFAAWKRRESLPTPSTLDAAHRAVDEMSQAIALPAVAERTDHRTEETSATAPQPVPASTGETETVRITVNSLDARLLEAEEMLAAKLAADQRASDLGALAARLELWRKEWARVQPRTRALRQELERPRAAAAAADLHGLAEFFDWNHDYLRALEGKVAALRRTAEQDRLLIGKLVDDLLENSKKLLMLPLARLAGLLSKLVRDLCRDQGKEAELTIRGEEVTIDKRVLEQLKDPLVHLLRNCIDHGIETPEQRRRAGKPPRAAITLTVSPVNSTQVEISVSDDGVGIDVEKVKAAAGKRGLVALNTLDQLSESAALALVFETDVSTSPMITRVSGRGLGLAIVREKAEKLGGRVAIESRRGSGTTIRMTLPLTLATFRGVLIESARRLFVLPTAQVERVTRFKLQEVRTVEGRRTLALDGRAVALVDLAEVLQLPSTPHKSDRPEAVPILVLGAGEQRVAFAVDAVLDEREVLVKRLTKPLSRVRNIAGATVLGSGEVAPILNVADLLKSARTAGAGLRTPAAAMPAAMPAKRILVVEDSITSRMLLKGILESAGYDVKTAVDGIDAFTALRAERFDLVVSDVEMPRMNGFDLTARIRADHALAEVPVVLVTALESREDRERGIDVGANAYLVKSSLDQSNLLEALRRLA
jgi:two-component system chemotaxis sensor kinase CheA